MELMKTMIIFHRFCRVITNHTEYGGGGESEGIRVSHYYRNNDPLIKDNIPVSSQP